jgi:NAD(P)-dependent dehydrogenase (short-subunit alcohol dehydrogenase family)
MTLKKKTIIITGASRGIGLAIALRYAASEANIVVLTKDFPETIDNVSISQDLFLNRLKSI